MKYKIALDQKYIYCPQTDELIEVVEEEDVTFLYAIPNIKEVNEDGDAFIVRN